MVRALASHARGHWFKSSTAHHQMWRWLLPVLAHEGFLDNRPVLLYTLAFVSNERYIIIHAGLELPGDDADMGDRVYSAANYELRR